MSKIVFFIGILLSGATHLLRAGTGGFKKRAAYSLRLKAVRARLGDLGSDSWI